jgi:phosphatidylglycerol lysyltransferase
MSRNEHDPMSPDAPLIPPRGERPGWLHAERVVPLLGLVIVAVALTVLYRTLEGQRFQEIWQAVHTLPARRIGAALLLTVASYLAMTLYDHLAVAYLHRALPWGKVSFASAISYVFSNNLGLSVVTGGSIRYRLYSSWGLTTDEVTRLVAFTTTTFWLGILALGGALFLVHPTTLLSSLPVPLHSTRSLGLVFVGAVVAYLVTIAVRRDPVRLLGWELPLPTLHQGGLQIAVGVVDWLVAGSVLFALLPPAAGLSFWSCLAVYLLAQVVALISNVPGGLGVFETMVLTLCPGLPKPALLGALLAYRAIYYLLPLATATLLLGLHELGERHAVVVKAARTAGRWTAPVIPQMLGLAVLVAGAVLLFSGAIPAHPARLVWLQQAVPLPVVEASHFLASVTGACLLLLGRGLQRRLDGAWLVTTGLLGVAVAASLLTGAHYGETLFLALLLATTLPCRRQFYRRASLLSEPFTPQWIATIALVLGCTVWLGLFAYKHVDYSHELWWRFAFAADAPRFLRATVGTTIVVLIFATAKLLRPAPPEPTPPGPADLATAANLVTSAARSTAYLALLGDKSLLFDEARSGFLMYGVEGRSWVAMGDPVAAPEVARELAWQFRAVVERHAGWPVFYEVGPDTLPLYVDMGLTPLKIGEEARVALGTFDLEGPARRGLRYIHRRLGKEGCTCEVVPAPAVTALLPELQAISDAWLADKRTREKGFSLGFFDDAYLRHCPVAVVRQQGRAIAFTNLWLAGNREELSLDLMRHLPEAPNGVMDYLFVSLMLWGKEHDYRWLSLGMAPLAGLENRPFAPLWNRIGAMIFRHGEEFYNFAGLRHYKAKFDPVWEPRYLVCPGGAALPRILLNIATLISGGVTGILTK